MSRKKHYVLLSSLVVNALNFEMFYLTLHHLTVGFMFLPALKIILILVTLSSFDIYM